MQIRKHITSIITYLRMNLLTELFPLTVVNKPAFQDHQEYDNLSSTSSQGEPSHKRFRGSPAQTPPGTPNSETNRTLFQFPVLNKDRLMEPMDQGLIKYNAWHDRKMKIAQGLHYGGMTPTMFCDLEVTETFENDVIPRRVRRDVQGRKKTCQQEFVADEDGIIRGLTGIVQHLSLGFTNYNPFFFHSPTGKPTADQAREIQRITKEYDIKHPVTDPATIVQIPNNKGEYIFGRDNVNQSRVDYEVAKNVSAKNLAAAIIAGEAYNTRKLLPLLVLAGMGGGKSATLYEIFANWPGGATRKAFSFQDKAHIRSRNGNSMPCDKIEKFSDIKIENIQRRNSNFPALFVFDESQFADEDSLEEFLRQCVRCNIKVVMAGISYDLGCEEWKAHKLFRNMKHRHIYRLHCSCQICNEVGTEMSAQLRSRPVEVFYEDMEPKAQWIRTCVACSFRYFPYCWVSKRTAPGVYDNTP